MIETRSMFQIDQHGGVTEMKNEPVKRFCPKCHKMTANCGHEISREDPTAILSDSEMLLISERAVKGLEINPKVARVDGREEITVRGHTTLTPFFEEITGGQTVHVTCRPQIGGRPLRLVYGGPPKTFHLIDIMVGKNSQFSCPGNIPMECFLPHPEPGEPINNIQGIDRFQPSFSLTLVVQNITGEKQSFGAFILSDDES